MKVDDMNEIIAKNQTKGSKRNKYPQYVNSGDPKQMKLLKKVQAYMKEMGSSHSVFTSLKVVAEFNRLVALHEEYQHEIHVIRTAIRMIETSKTYARVRKGGQ